jgi:hypothetical protein
MPITPATWEVKIGKIVVRDQSRQKVHETPSQPIKVGCGEKRAVCNSRERPSPEFWHIATLSSDFQPPEGRKIKSVYVLPTL